MTFQSREIGLVHVPVGLMGGSKRARVGMLLYSTVRASSAASLFVKAFDTAVSLFRCGLFWHIDTWYAGTYHGKEGGIGRRRRRRRRRRQGRAREGREE
ncbi:hypothetical protein BHE74_00012883 [Ensete ventricosum]|nr:hypothetical protein BHE74_00012883 [Ensete ventricosum]